MKLKTYYLACEREINGKCEAFVLDASGLANIACYIHECDIVRANIMPSRKQAQAVVNDWNNISKKHNMYLYE